VLRGQGNSRLMERSRVTLNTIALELVPPNVDEGPERALEDARKVVRYSAESGLDGRIRHVMIPGMIAEEDDRPVPMKPKLDVLDFWSIIKPELPGFNGLCTQVTAFMDEPSLRQRLTRLSDAGMEGVVFVGVPRTMNDGEGSGVAPTDALSIYRELVTNRGVILIPTREGEHGRLNFKCNQGATYGMTQLLYSDSIVGFLTEFAKNTDHRPEIQLSFGFVPKVESRIGLINWLIQDPGNAAVADEQAFVKRLAGSEPAQKRQLMLDLYQRVIDGVADLGFPLSIHLEATYGVSGPAFETFAEMIAYWSPAQRV
jgi:Mycobacterial methylenetetrahydrofolate reductase